MFPLLFRLSLLFPSSLFFYPRSLNAHAFIYLSLPSLPSFVPSSNRGSLTLLSFRRRCHSLGTHTLSRFIDAIASRRTQLFVHPPPSTLFGPVFHWYKVLPT
ncbi:hypothetical protein IWW34DRAFT_27387 [Fusarium oxysporum f. sp. albedinis]|nr:hypothetical protein IWW34DRAFT_27387 [Fusarium oxysporum f. sp. albedinis]